MVVDQNAFIDKLYVKYYSQLLRYTLIHLRNPSLAEELVQDTFHDANIKIDALSTHDNPGGWLMRTVQNKINNYNRATVLDMQRYVSYQEEIASQGATVLSAEDRMIEKENLREIVTHIQHTLSPEDIYFLTRIAFDKASHKEMAIELNISVWASQKRLERIRKKLDKNFPSDFRKK
ncbi:sigma-70 family RNA polymerase sigma factor [Bengtsoniella intestinalis]|uniref:RNA polymerase sigma factor n=1 Tax=Bengtsoniella intestinalis TaxID=3073143 RepID=UPI00391FC7C9